MIFDRVKPLDAILATAEKKSLHRSLGAFQLTMLGIGAIIGTGIFVLTAEAAQKAGPGMMLSFVIAGFVCAVAALCYSELASMVPVSGSADLAQVAQPAIRSGEYPVGTVGEVRGAVSASSSSCTLASHYVANPCYEEPDA